MAPGLRGPISPLVWMSSASAVLAGVAIDAGAPAPEVLWGMAGPLGAAMTTWVLVLRTLRTAPDRLTNVMLKAFAGKTVFFGAYVVAMLRGLMLAATPFAVSFTTFFIGVYVIEALCLQRLVIGTR